MNTKNTLTQNDLSQLKKWLIDSLSNHSADAPLVIKNSQDAQEWQKLAITLYAANQDALKLKDQNYRLEGLLNILIKQTQLDFSEEAPISPSFDELDGIALGLNTLAQEFAFYQQKIEQLNLELKQLLYKSSHDIRGPIASLHGMIDLLSLNNQINESEKKDFLELINASYEILNNLAYCAFISPESIAWQSIDLNEFLECWISKIRLTNYTVAFKPSKDPMIVRSEAKGLTTILNIFLSNALIHGFSQTRKNTLSFTIKRDLTNIELYCIDNGVGIPSKAKDKVFEMFYKANTTKKTSGLGLYTAKKIALALGGDLKLMKDEPSTTFCLQLPIN